MRAFSCETCHSPVYFENSRCVTCGSRLGWSRPQRSLVVLAPITLTCPNALLNGCNWIPEVAGDLCFACQLTRTRPSDDDEAGMTGWYEAEAAKRRLLFELDELGLPVQPYGAADGTGTGVTFDLLSSTDEPVTTGHADGVITLDLAEGLDAHREKVRSELDEPYRTMLGHFRHEIGHYYWQLLVDGTDHLASCRALFGDDTASYADALDRHYHHGAPDGWEAEHVSRYATMHPWEDFAETFAHVLHIRDTLQTAGEFGLTVPLGVSVMRFGDVVRGVWLPLSYALNQINRSMGHDDLYPFLLSDVVIDKLQYVADLLDEARVPTSV